jgi:RimJ/RimL family protein N-acetyltransferase
LKPIGFIGLQKIAEYDLHHRNSDLFLYIEKAKQRKGYGGEAIEWALKWGFDMRELHRVSIGYIGWNPDAGRLYERLGFVQEGRERECFFSQGRFWDKVVMGMLEGEWRALEAKRRTVVG